MFIGYAVMFGSLIAGILHAVGVLNLNVNVSVK
jgi:hypothetical protein